MAAATDVVNSLQREVEIVKEGLKSVDETIKKLTGRDPSESRGTIGNRRISVKRNFGDRTGGPAQKRFNTGNAFGRLGPRVPLSDREQQYGQLESDGEEEEDDTKKPTIQSSVVATPAPSRLQQDAHTDKKTRSRNKRMFGVLLGTLQKFKESSSKEAARERRRQEIEKKLEETAEREREEASRQRKELYFARKEKQAQLETLERKMEVAEMLEEWEEHDKKLAKYIRTKTEPYLYYLPAKHNDHTLDLLKKTAEKIKKDIKKRREEVEEVLPKAEADEESKEGGNDWDIRDQEQDKGGKQELADRLEGEHESRERGDERRIDREEGATERNVNGENFRAEEDQKKEEELSEKTEEEHYVRGNRYEEDDRVRSEDVKGDEMRDGNPTSVVKEIPRGEEKKAREVEEQQQPKESEMDTVDPVDEKETAAGMQVDPGASDAD